ncbi:MAG: flavin reductase family protein [Nostocoides sp.]
MSGEPGSALEADFRLAMGRFASGVCVVTTTDGTTDYAMTVASVCSVSLDPALLLVCIEKGARFHDVVIGAGRFTVNILSATQRPISQWLATRGRPVQGQLQDIPHRLGSATGTAVIDGAQASIEARTFSVHPAGDHSIIVGEALSIEVDEQTVPLPLVHYRSGYTTVTS